MDENNSNSNQIICVNKENEERQKNAPSDKMKQKNPINMVFNHMTSLVHVFVLGFTIFLIVLCSKEEFHFFTWHPLLMSIGWLLLMSEAILFLAKDNILTCKLKLRGRIFGHWGMQVVACALIFAAFGVAVQNKEDLDRKHFTSWHGICGVISVSLCVPTMILGSLAVFSAKFKAYVRPTVNKFFHSTFGILTFVMGSATLILSLKTQWFEGRTNNSDLAYALGMFILVLNGLWTLIQPLLNNIKRFKTF